MSANIDKIIADANAAIDRLNTIEVQVESMRSDIAMLEAEDPCSEGFLERLNAIESTAVSLTSDYRQLWADIKIIKQAHADLGILDFGDKAAADAAIANLDNTANTTNGSAKEFNGPARRKALRDANAKCGVTSEPSQNTDVKAAAENKQSDDARTTSSTVNTSSSGASSGNTGAENTTNVTSGNNTSNPKKLPGARLYNPLSAMSSYTYNLTLYLVSPEIANQFVKGGGTMAGIDPVKDPIYIVAQSGGSNTGPGGTEKRIKTPSSVLGPGESFEYYIDDLVIDTKMPNQDGEAASVATELRFKIFEPHGFSFLSNLAAAAGEINANSAASSGVKQESMPSLTEQFFILGIKFYGYDVNGLPVKNGDPTVSDYTGGYAGQNSVIERFYGIILSSVKFKLDGRMVTYQCIAKPVSETEAFGEMNASLKKPETLAGSTVYDILMGGADASNGKSMRGLAKALNDMQEGFKDQQMINKPNVYKFEFLDQDGKNVGKDSPIAKAKVYNPATVTNASAPTSKSNSTDKITINDSINAVSINKNESTVTVAAGQSIVTVIDNLIIKSTYISDCLNKVATQGVETKNKDNPSVSTLSWFSVNPVVQVIGRDDKLNNWSYEITYQIKPYDVPFINSPYSDSISHFPGAYKKYDYWLTGENTEIISYSQEYNNLFYLPVPMSTGNDDSVGNSRSGIGVKKAISGSPGKVDPSNGGQNKGSQISESVKASLSSQGDQANAKIKIIGDPDYLMTGIGVNNSGFPKYYGNGYSINPTSGQVFIKINFRTADDYNNKGYLNILSPIQFYQTNAAQNAGVEGIIYMVKGAESTFSKGAFSQTLDLVLVPEEDLNQGTSPKTEAQREVKKDAPKPAVVGIPSVDLRTPTSSLGKGVQSILNPPSGYADPTQSQVLNSEAYRSRRRNGVAGDVAYNQAKAELIANVAKDDQNKSTTQQKPAPRTTN